MRHGFERVDPQRVDLHGLPRARGNDPVADFGVHPGELHAGAAGKEQTVGGIGMNVVARALHVGINNPGENWKKFLQRRGVLRGREILADGLEIPERGIHGVVFGLAAGVRKIVRQHPAINVARKGKKNPLRNIGAPSRERQSWQRDHGVAAPIAEPVIAGDDAAAVRLFRQAALDDELVGGEDELPQPGGRFR